MYKCEECNIEFKTFQAKANHHRWKHLKYAYKTLDTKEKFHLNAVKREEEKYGEWIEEDTKCSNELCLNNVHLRYHKRKKKNKNFCCQSCANTHKHSDESKKKISEELKKRWKNGVYDTDSYREKQSSHAFFSSKKEREIVKYFKDKYPEYEWKSGAGLIYNGTTISRDLYSNNLKICFEYDGIWHFEDIKGQLSKKQFKDKLLEEWCIKNNYRLIRIDEKSFKNFEQLEKLFFQNIEPIIKIGQRY
jgi:hypothetical protein